MLLYIVPVYHSPTLKLYFQIFVSKILADIFLSRKRNGKVYREKNLNYICVDRDISGFITDVLRSRVVTLVLKIYFTIIMYPDCSSTQICLIHAARVFLELTQLDVCVVQFSICARHLYCPAIIWARLLCFPAIF